ncbi:MAG: ribonuclease III [Oligoflexia bacterium]|nr:ribonuclease III [Oligoflexia bacterium]
MATPNLYLTALTHSSWANEHGGEHNERLEFLGDAVLQLCISDLLFHRLSREREGVLTRARRHLVNGEILAALALDLGLDQALRIGSGEETIEPKPLSGVFEAMLGAVYLDGGLPAAMAVVQATVLPHLADNRDRRDPKSRLQEWCQQQHSGALPTYEDIGQEGPDNQPLWRVQVRVDGEVLGQGAARKKKYAHRAAAKQALDRLGLDDSSP